MSWFWWLVLGLLGGWLIELAIDFRYWRKRAVLAQQRIAEQEADLGRKSQALAAREAEASTREREVGLREETLAQRDADLLAQARRIDERDQEISRIEQRLDARRAELDKHAAELIERDRDITARTLVLKTGEAGHAQREARVASVESEQSRRQASLASRENALKNWEQRILSKEQDIGLREAGSVRLEREHDNWRRQFDAMRGLFGARYRTASGADDLQALEGVGPKALGLLGAAGITSFERLADTPLGELSRLVEQGGADLALADPMSWAEQASLIAAEDFVAFENLKATLRGEPPLLAGHDVAVPGDAGQQGEAVTGSELAVIDTPLEIEALASLPQAAPVSASPLARLPTGSEAGIQKRLELEEMGADTAVVTSPGLIEVARAGAQAGAEDSIGAADSTDVSNPDRSKMKPVGGSSDGKPDSAA